MPTGVAGAIGMRRSLVRASTALLVAAAVAGCSVGVQQTVMTPKVDGAYTFSGVDMVATSPPGWSGKAFTLPVKLAPQSGKVGPTGSMTQIPLGLDFPFARLVVAPGLSSEANLDMLQVDALYKHPLASGDGRLRALAGISWLNLDAKVEANYKLAIQDPVSIGNAIIQNGDAVKYTSKESRTGWYLTGGAEYTLAWWAHAFVQVSARLTQGSSRSEDLVITATQGGYDSQGRVTSKDFHVLSDANFVVQQNQKGTLSAQFNLPPVMGLIGLSITWPSWDMLKSRSFRPAPPPPPYPPPGAYPPGAYPPGAYPPGTYPPGTYPPGYAPGYRPY